MRIENSFLQAEVSPGGGVLTSLKLFGKELIPLGNENRLCFPVIGEPVPLVLDEVSYSLPRNGFLQHEDLDLKEATSEKLVFSSPDDPKRKGLYPFDYDLELSYELEEDVLIIRAKIANRGEKTMPFQFGFHHEFTVDLGTATFDFKEAETNFVPMEGDYVSPISQFSKATDQPITGEELIKEGQTLIIDAPHHSISLHTGTGVRIEFRYACNIIAISRPNALALSVDPWWGLAPRGEEEENPLDRETFLKLPPKSERVYEARLRFSLD